MWQQKAFNELTTLELWKIYQLRVAVFVVEQTCPYQEVDEADKTAIHLWQEVEGNIQAYCRIVETDEYMKIGRLIVAESARGTGLAKMLMSNAIVHASQLQPNKAVFVQAQAYLQKFYQSFGFKPVSEVYLEDDIPHLDMVLEAK